jgi:predicted SAM-dependent methyltransferase
VDEILCEHIIEHLTFEQFNRAIVEWHRVLKVGGCLIIECPDLLGLCKQFVKANEFGRFQSYRGFWSLQSHFYGHQRGSSDEEKLAQVHKSGYTMEHLKTVLDGVGFGEFDELTPLHGVPHTAVLRLKALKAREEPHGEV